MTGQEKRWHWALQGQSQASSVVPVCFTWASGRCVTGQGAFCVPSPAPLMHLPLMLSEYELKPGQSVLLYNSRKGK